MRFGRDRFYLSIQFSWVDNNVHNLQTCFYNRWNLLYRERNNVTFTDESEISDYAKEAVSYLASAGIINGMGDGTFAPAGTVTRAQAAKVVYGLLNLVGGVK